MEEWAVNIEKGKNTSGSKDKGMEKVLSMINGLFDVALSVFPCYNNPNKKRQVYLNGEMGG